VTIDHLDQLAPPPPTLADVARAAGVSVATASRVLNGSARVRPDTRKQVEDAITLLGYVRNRAAWGDQQRSTGSVAFVVCEEGTRLFADSFFARILWAASRRFAARDMQLVLLTVQSSRHYRARATRFLRSGHVDGALFVSMHTRHPMDLSGLGIPVVVGGRPLGDGASELSYVDVDNRGGAELAVRHLVASGRTTIATVAGPLDMAAGVDRLAGYRAVLAESGLSDDGLIAYGDFGQASGDHGMIRLLERRPDIDAVFAGSDLMAAGVLRALRRTGRQVPDEVAVIGFDDSPLARRTDPPLTTVRQPIEMMGTRMAQELLALIDDRETPPRHVVLDTTLALRGSA
jgi:DNA-binding LacI/PurR family transcriptional regulator